MNLERAIELTKEKNIIDVDTGEVISLKEATDIQLSKFLTRINEMQRASAKVEDYLKKEVKERIKEDSWQNDEQYIGNHRVKKFFVKRFDTKKYDVEATEFEKKVYEEVKEKFSVLSETIRIGG